MDDQREPRHNADVDGDATLDLDPDPDLDLDRDGDLLASDAALPDEADTAATVRCAGPCDREVYAAATVDVVAGAVIGEWDGGRWTPSGNSLPHVGVTGVNGGLPEVERWCTNCARREYDIEQAAHEQRLDHARRYVTAATVAAFLLGCLLTYLVSAVVVV